jgi:glycogen debranching enzyme
VWSAADGSIGGAPIHGIAHSDVRIVRALTVRVGDADAEHLVTSSPAADHVVIESLLRHLDDPTPDPGVRLRVDRRVRADGCGDTLTITNRHPEPLTTTVEIVMTVDATLIDVIKQGRADASPVDLRLESDTARWSGEHVSVRLVADGLTLTTRDTEVVLAATITVPAGGRSVVSWTIDAHDAIAAVTGAVGPAPWSRPETAGADPRLQRWVERALSDLDALRLTVAGHPEHQFLAAGAPWFFTLFGRDSLWAARMLLPLGTRLAGDTLQVLARLQGTQRVDATAEEPGKIMHELRRQSLVIDDDVTLPPLYFGTVDATALWVCLLHDAWRAGLPEAEVRGLLPALEAALGWMRDHGDADGDGLLEYIDRTGHGLANQGWKDSGDSVQWRDGRLAQGPIALCEVQAYAYEAALGGAALLDAFDRPGAAEWRRWAEQLRSAFHDRFWITDPAVTGELGPYPAIALDADKRPVDSVTSNLGHLLGTGILDAEQAALVARRLGSPELDSGYGLRTLSTDAEGYWPLSYHGGSVWTHDTAIAIQGLVREGHGDVAAALAEGLLRVAESNDFRMPELHSGDGVDITARPVPYPASCRPQAWSAAAAIAVLGALT